MRRGRKEKELVCAGGPVAGFAGALREARRKAGSPTYRQMAQSAHYSGPALSQAANGAKLPTWPVTAAYLKACGVTELAPWENDWKIARLETKLVRARNGSPATTVSKPDVAPTPREQILDMLNRLGHAKGLSLRAIGSQTKICQAALVAKGGPAQTLSSATIHEVLTGQRSLTEDFITVYLNAIGATAEEQGSLGEAIGRLEYKLHRSDSLPQPVLVARCTAPALVPMPRAIGRAAVPQQGSTITAAVLDSPIADSFIAEPIAAQPVRWRITDPRVRRHRSVDGFHVQSKAVLRAGTVTGATIFGGLACWIIALAMATIRHTPVAAATEFGSTVLITSGAIMLAVVLLLFHTVFQDPEDSPPVRQRRRAPLRQWFYKGRHQASLPVMHRRRVRIEPGPEEESSLNGRIVVEPRASTAGVHWRDHWCARFLPRRRGHRPGSLATRKERTLGYT
ncbi:MAG TPA: hypothetical protein DGT23_07085 [Micromonosporaceae bacterium]|nr:hypothetical protein [Micromonosporaceae bacterium]